MDAAIWAMKKCAEVKGMGPRRGYQYHCLAAFMLFTASNCSSARFYCQLPVPQ